MIGIGYGMRIEEVALDGEGRIVAAGDYLASNNEFMVLRLTRSGALDTTFGNSGRRVRCYPRC